MNRILYEMLTFRRMNSITTILLAHFVEREKNLKRIIDDLMEGTVKSDKIIVFVDNLAIRFKDKRVTTIYSDTPFFPIIRFALGTSCDTDYCFFLDDDLTVQKKTLENLVFYALRLPQKILGFEGSMLGNTETPYSNDIPIKRGFHEQPVPVDVIIRTYFVPTSSLMAGLLLRSMYPELPKESLDDVFLCLGNKYINNKENYVIPVGEETNLVELPDRGVGQSLNGEHYKNSDIVCRFLMNKYV